MFVLGVILLILGAITSYLDKNVYKFIFKAEPEGNDSLKIKGIGFTAALLGAVLIVIFFR